MTATLTPGGILTAYHLDPSQLDADGRPPALQLQVLHVKHLVGQGNASDRYKLILSDGTNFMTGMVGSQLNALVSTGQLVRYAVIRLNRYMVNTVSSSNSGLRIMIVVEMNIIGQEAGRIGEPVDVMTVTGQSSSDMKPKSNGAPAPSVYSGAGMPGVPAYKGGAAKTESGSAQQQQHSGNVNVFPINMLNPYQNKWTICARVIAKSDIRRWNNARGEGKLFSVTFADESGEIRATGFNDAVDAHFDKLIENQVYYISKGQIKAANKQYSNVKNDYEMTFDSDTTVTVCDSSAVPGIRYNAVPINQLTTIDKDETVDIIAVVKETGALSDLISKTTQKPLKKRELSLVDTSGYQVRLTLWGKTAESFEHFDSPVVAIKGVKVGDYGGRSLSMMAGSNMSLNPDIPEAHQLRGWYDSNGQGMTFHSFSSAGGQGGSGGSGGSDVVKPISAIKDEQLGMGEKADYLTIRGTVTYIKAETMSYPACPSEGCNKKVLESGSGWRCEKCDRSYAEPEHRFILTTSVSDFSGQVWLQAFNEAGIVIMGKTANELVEMRDTDSSAFEAYVKSRLFQTYDFKVRVKTENYQDEAKVRCSITGVGGIEYGKACKELCELIEQMGL